MKLKLFAIALAALASGQAFVSHAMDVEGKVFLGCNGNANNFGLVGFTEKWELTSEDGVVYTGTFDFMKSENLQFSFYIVDADYDADGVCPVDYGNFIQVGPGKPGRFTVVNTGFYEKYGYFYNDDLLFNNGEIGDGAWQLPSTDDADGNKQLGWNGGSITFTVDFSGELPKVAMETYYDPATGNYSVWYFNTKEGAWPDDGSDQLRPETDNPLVLKGQFGVGKDCFAVNIAVSGRYLVPSTDGETPTGSDMAVFGDGGVFTGKVALSPNPWYWTCGSWPGGDVEVTFDIMSGTVTFTTDVETDGIAVVTADDGATPAYDINGLRVSPESKGIKIVKGKKMITL